MSEGKFAGSMCGDAESYNHKESFRFGHHPDPVTDFCIEVDSLYGMRDDVAAGLASLTAFNRRVADAMEFRVGGNPDAVAAKKNLRGLL